MRQALLLFSFFFVISSPAYAVHPIAPFEEVVQTCDLIFAGTVSGSSARLSESGRTVLTDVRLGNIEVIYSSSRSVQKTAGEVSVTYEGGASGNLTVSANDDYPAFADGRRYIVFIFDDGRTYQNPVIGGAGQGFFPLMKDSGTGIEYVLTSDGRAVLGTNRSGLIIGSVKIASIRFGVVYADPNQNIIPDSFYASAPIPSTQSQSSRVYDFSIERDLSRRLPLTFSQFKSQISLALQRPLANRVFKIGTAGRIFRNIGGQMTEEPIPQPLQVENPVPARPSGLFRNTSATMGACGFHKLSLVMEQVPSDWWCYWDVNGAVWTWNQFMDIFRVTPSDGGIGFDNGQNEFAGWLDDATRYSIYGGYWGTALAVTTSRDRSSTECSEIVESDVQWNPAYSWTDDPAFALGNKDVVLFQLITLHELGHTWGEQRWKYKETYMYDVPTVMQGYSSSVVEDGGGVHVTDAYLIRRQYQDQTSILGTRDVGVESYYASAGLHNSTTNATSYIQGQPIVLQNVTVENIGYSAVSDLTVRFYLSDDREITDSDYLIGSGSWSSFPGEKYTVFSFTGSIPFDIPPGTYYVGAIVTINGLESDDFTMNNATSFYSPITVTPAPLSAPTAVSASDGKYTDKIRVTWNPVAHAASYGVYRAGSPLFSKTYLGSVPDTTYDDTSVPADKYYYYWIQAENPYVKSKLSTYDSGYKRASMKVGSPLAGQICLAGSICRIAWTYDGNISRSVKIVLIKTDSQTTTTLVSSTSAGANGVGSFDWLVPQNLAAGSYRVRIMSLFNLSYPATSDLFMISSNNIPPP